MKKIIKKITAMAVMSLFAATQLQTPQVNVQAADGVATAEKTTAKQPKIYGRSGIVIDAKSGKILYAKKIDDRHYPASITKILTKIYMMKLHFQVMQLTALSQEVHISELRQERRFH